MMQPPVAAVVAVATSLLVLTAASAEAKTSTFSLQTSSAVVSPSQCLAWFQRKVKQGEHHRYVRAVYHRDRITLHARRRIERMQKCALSVKAALNMKYVQDQAASNRRKRRVEEQRRRAIPPILKAIAECESHGDPTAISPGGRYRGKYQFSFATWRSVGGRGDPAQASEAEQDRRAAILLRTGGIHHWPVCGPMAQGR